jgi:hypothetical protein
MNGLRAQYRNVSRRNELVPVRLRKRSSRLDKRKIPNAEQYGHRANQGLVRSHVSRVYFLDFFEKVLNRALSGQVFALRRQKRPH